MNEWLSDARGGGSSPADADSAADYRIRELEARLDRRLALLESQRMRTRWMARLTGAALVVTLVTLAGVLWGAAGNDDAWTVESLSAREVVLRDADGFERGRLATDAGGRAQLALSDRDGRERIRLAVLADGSPGVTISDQDARPRAVLGYLPDGTTNLVFADGSGISRAVLGLEPDGSTQALFADASGAIRALVGVRADGAPSVSTYETQDEGEAPGRQ